MSYSIIRNANYKKDNLAGLYKHNERKNHNYSNKDIDRKKTSSNYSIKHCNTTYTNRLKQLTKEFDLKGRIISTTNVMSEYIITSSKEFFEKSSFLEIQDYFNCAYDFVCEYNNLGEDFIVSANVHLDESTPHLHLVYIPVVHKLDAKSGKLIHKIACSEYWKGKDSYRKLQDAFYKYMVECGFDLERGKSRDIKHLSVEEFKKVTDYENVKKELQKDDFEVPINLENENKSVILNEHRKLVGYCKELKGKLYKCVKAVDRCEELERENANLKSKVTRLEKEKNQLEKYIENAFEVVKTFLHYPIKRFKFLIETITKAKDEVEDIEDDYEYSQDNFEYTNDEIDFKNK